MIKETIQLLITFYLESDAIHYLLYFIILLLILLISLMIVLYLKMRRQKSKEKLRKHLTEQEEIIFNILEQKNGSCYQSTLSFISKIPKSSLSGILDELERRNIIKREKKGNKKIISIKY